MTTSHDPSDLTALRWTVYWLLIVASAGTMIGRISTVVSKEGHTAMLSANDRSRWATIRALVDHGTYRLDEVIFERSGRRNRTWYTIDLVQHRGPDGRQHYYSSKPPLLPTMLAGLYWVVQQTTGAKLATEPFFVIRLMLVLINVVPMVIYFVLLAKLVEQFGTSHWGRLVVMTAATFGTFLTSFAITLNNHNVAAVSVVIALFAGVRIWQHPQSGWGYYALAGLFAAFAATNELPALSFVALLGGCFFLKSPLRTLAAYVPAALVVALAFFGTNYYAHQSWRPPYAHRQDGPVVLTLEKLEIEQTAGNGRIPVADQLRARLAEQAGITLTDRAVWQTTERPSRWVLWDPGTEQKLAAVEEAGVWQLREWDNWYEYEGSYWTSGRKSRIDQGERSPAVYAFHAIMGHHGILSLTPFWLLTIGGAVFWATRRLRPRTADGLGLWDRISTAQWLALITIVLTLVCLAFYLSRPLEDRNYGGMTSGLRWMFWFIPLWLICALPAADWLAGSRWRRAIALLLLLISIASASYTPLNPWTHPWLYVYWEYLGWL